MVTKKLLQFSQTLR